MGPFTYWAILAGSVLFPLLLSFDKKVAYHLSWKYVLPGAAVMALFFIVWDAYFTHYGVWSFNDAYIMGIRFLGLPIEEICFFIVIPFCCIFIYDCLIAYLPNDPLKKFEKYITIAVLAVCVFLAIRHTGKAYTFYTNFFTVSYLSVLLFFRVNYLSRFYLAYLVSLIPFLIVNGLLTAIPVVLYNDNENLGVRIYTIPADDLVYGFLMILMSVSWYEFFKGRRKQVAGTIQPA
jgi:lycopene cyclase domain-containing protein